MYLDQVRKVATVIAHVTNSTGFIDAYSLLRERIAKSQAVILRYHGVGNNDEFPWNVPLVKPQEFENHIRYLRQRYDILSLELLVKYIRDKNHWPKKSAIITFDDGYKDNFTYAYPILKKYDIPATINLTTAHIDTGNLFWFDKVKFCLWHTKHKLIQLDGLGIYYLRTANERLQAASRINEKLKTLTEYGKNQLIDNIMSVLRVEIPDDIGKKLILSWDEVREMRDAGVSFGSHSINHPILTKLPPEQAKREIIQSKADIEERLGQEITVFCYPDGKFNAEISEFVKEAGYHCVLTSIPRMVNPETSLYEFGRIPAGWNLSTLKLFSSGVYSDLYAILKRI